MVSSKRQSSRSSFGARLRTLYERAREPALYLIVILALIGQVLNLELLRSAALYLTAGIVLRLLFEIHHSLRQKPEATRVVAKLAVGEDQLREFVNRAIAEDHRVHIRWIGMTMFNVWNTMEGVFEDLSRDAVKEVKFDVAMSASEWLDANRINDGWTGAAANSVRDKMRAFEKWKQTSDAGKIGWEFDIRRYGHMPAVHGGLINDKYLFLGIARWEHGNLKAGDRPYEVHTMRDGEFANDRIRVFRDWFDYCFKEPDVRPPRS